MSERYLFGDFYFMDAPEGKFGFAVGREAGEYWVNLPHQCDWWEIADGATKSEAIDKLSAFIAEATEALAALMEEVAV